MQIQFTDKEIDSYKKQLFCMQHLDFGEEDENHNLWVLQQLFHLTVTRRGVCDLK